MDPSIMKLLEDDEDEHLHSGADVEALTAALNRDIGGPQPGSQPSVSRGSLSHGNSQSSFPLSGEWPQLAQEEPQVQQHQQPHEQQNSQLLQQQQSSDMECVMEHQPLQSHPPGEHEQMLVDHKPPQPLQLNQNMEKKPNPSEEIGYDHNSNAQVVRNPELDTYGPPENQQQHPHLVNVNVQQEQAGTGQVNASMRQFKSPSSIPFGLLMPILCSQLDKDRAMQLMTAFNRLKKAEINKGDFMRLIKGIVGEQTLKQAAQQLQQKHTQAIRNSANQQQFHLQQSQTPSQQSVPLSQGNTQLLAEPQSIPKLTSNQHQKSYTPSEPQSHIPNPTLQMQTDSMLTNPELSAQKSRQTGERQHDAQGTQSNQVSSVNMDRPDQEKDLSVVSIQQQQHMHIPHSPFSMYGHTMGNYHSQPFPMPSANVQASSGKTQPQDSQIGQVAHAQGMSSSQPVSLKNMPRYELHGARNETNRLQSGSVPQIASQSAPQQNQSPWQSSLEKEQMSSGMSSIAYVKPEPNEQASEHEQKPQMPITQNPSSFGAVHHEQGRSFHGPSKDEPHEKQSARMNFASSSNISSSSQLQTSSATHPDHKMQVTQTPPVSSATIRMPSTITPAAAVTNTKNTPKKPSVGQKKPFEALGNPTQQSSKKQKVAGEFADQSIEQLNDVTAVSGVNLREEEEQLFSTPKEESRASEATRRVVQEEEERMILQKGPLQKKIVEIMAKCKLKSTGNDVERCLSMCVEERMRGLISNLIRISKQRVDIEKPRHRSFTTSDVRRQILSMNRRAKEDWEKKQAEEAEKLRKLNETEGSVGVDGEKDEARAKASKANKEEDDKMRTNAANVAARAAVGGDDMLSKWQLMAEQARQKREGGLDGSASGSSNKDTPRKPFTAIKRTVSGGGDRQEAEHKGPSSSMPVARRPFGRAPAPIHPLKIMRRISVKDVIALLEREPQMSKSTLMYRLYERMSMDGSNTPEKAGD
ncbi:hypothetical protein AMTRI_Chr03g146230 [Amborella trichopoda]